MDSTTAATLIAPIGTPAPPATTLVHENGVVNGNYGAAHHSGNVTNGQDKGEGQKLVMDYPTDFPELPPTPVSADGAPTKAAGVGNGAWGRGRIQSSQTTQVFYLPPEERAGLEQGNQFGKSSNSEQDRCNEIAKRTGVIIELSESKDRALTVMLTGQRAKVEEARKLIVQQLQTQANRSIRIPKDHHKVLIGPGGKRLRELEAETNCRIDIPSRDTPIEDIKVIGPKDGIDRAIHAIQLISDEQSKKAQEHIVVPKMYYPWVRGPNDETLEAIRNETGAKVNIPPPMAQSDVIVITGEKEGVYKAAAWIKGILDEKSRVCKSVTCKVAKAQHRFVIGPGRSGLTDVLRQTGVSVEVPPEDADSDTITLRGEADRLGEALSLVYARASSVITAEIPCPNWLHRHIIGQKGAGLQQMGLAGAENKVQVNFEDNGTIYVEGPPEAVKSAHEKLSSKVIDLTSTMSFDVVKVHPTFHRHIIGKGGALIKKMKNETGVTISIPDEATNSDEIRVEGPKEGVAKAAHEIAEIAKRLENEKSRDILIESRFHKNLIGAKGEAIQKIRAAYPDVLVSFPEPGRKSDVINLRGPKEQLDKCYKHLQQLHKELLENNFQVQVPIFKDFHKNIIGKGGQTIRKLREETGTTIDLPAEDADDCSITVTGKKANVEKCVAQLTQIQNELASIITKEMTIPVKIQARLRRLIPDIQEESGGVHIRFPNEKQNSEKVTIRGPAEAVAKADKLLTDLVKDKEMCSFEASIQAKPEHHRFLIGKGGTKIKKLREQFPDVRVVFPRSNDADQDTIHLIGKQKDVEGCKATLEKIVAELNEITEISCEVPLKHHRHFVVRSAAVIREIQDANGGVVISFPKQGSNSTRVTIKGASDCCEAAKARIEEIVGDLEAAITTEVEIDPSHYPLLLRAGGRKVQDVCAACNVQIKFPDRNPRQMANGDAEDSPKKRDSTVLISGRPEYCEKAKEKLLALVPVTEKLDVPYEMHGGLIGKGGAHVRQIMEDYDVQVNIPKGELQINEIEIVGQAENVRKAIAHVMKLVEEYEEQQKDRELREFRMTIEVPPEYHQKLIGTRGANINNLRKQFGVNINIPPAGSEHPEQVALIGYEEKCGECKTAIEQWLNELRSMFSQEITLDARVHPRIIGAKGRSIYQIKEKFGVEITMPGREDPNPNLVTVSGKTEDAVYDCIDHLRNLEEEFLEDMADRHVYAREPEPKPVAKVHQVEMRNAPWAAPDLQNQSEFPSMGANGDIGGGGATAQTPTWGAWSKKR